MPRVEGLRVGPSQDPQSDYGPLVTAQHRDKVKGYINMGIEEGATLTNRHGIGIIVIKKQNPLKSYIHTPARENKDIDFDFCNLLVDENTDFSKFIKAAARAYETGY